MGTQGSAHRSSEETQKDGPARSDSVENGCCRDLSELVLPAKNAKGLFT